MDHFLDSMENVPTLSSEGWRLEMVLEETLDSLSSSLSEPECGCLRFRLALVPSIFALKGKKRATQGVIEIDVTSRRA